MLLKALSEARVQQGEARLSAAVAPAKTRSLAMPAREEPDIEQAMLRLDRTLAQGKPAKTRVPRGIYINVVV